QNIPCYVFEDIKIRLGWIEVSLRKKLSLSRMEAVREIQSFAEYQALFLSERYGCAIHCFAFRVQNYG
ncbi:hypothetical protein, partial [Segatella copri]|uniref:hypothetical protein n=1 Tax=Segatella copri TaxID=165179 RepID=UPI001D171281